MVLASLLLLLSVSAHACSAASCLDDGIELRGNFVVVVKHDGNPLPGVDVQITTFVDNEASTRFSGVTAFDGTVHVTNLSAGNYWIDAKLLEVNAAYHCFHVAKRASRKAKRRLAYEWGDLAPATRRIAGKLIDSEPGTDGTPIWNMVRRQNVPIVGARLKLQNPRTGAVFETLTDHEGFFALDGIPKGTYVLHAEGGKSARDYDSTDVLIKVSPSATRDTLLLTSREAGGGSCGGTSLDLQLQ